MKPDLLKCNKLQDGASSGGAVINSVDNSTPQDSVGDSPSSTAKLSRMAVLMSRSVWDKSSHGQSFPLRSYSPIANQLNKLTNRKWSVFALRTLPLGSHTSFSHLIHGTSLVSRGSVPWENISASRPFQSLAPYDLNYPKQCHQPLSAGSVRKEVAKRLYSFTS